MQSSDLCFQGVLGRVVCVCVWGGAQHPHCTRVAGAVRCGGVQGGDNSGPALPQLDSCPSSISLAAVTLPCVPGSDDQPERPLSLRGPLHSQGVRQAARAEVVSRGTQEAALSRPPNHSQLILSARRASGGRPEPRNEGDPALTRHRRIGGGGWGGGRRLREGPLPWRKADNRGSEGKSTRPYPKVPRAQRAL